MQINFFKWHRFWLSCRLLLISGYRSFRNPTLLEIFSTDFFKCFPGRNVVTHLKSTRLSCFLLALFLGIESNSLRLRSWSLVFDQSKISDYTNRKNCEESNKNLFLAHMIKNFSSPKMRNREFVFTPKIEYELVA